MTVFTFSAILLNMFFIFSLPGQSQKFSENLQKELLNLTDNERIKVWIYFTDKGDNLDSKLDIAKISLGERSKIRRSKVNKYKLVDKHDIPINNSYLRTIQPNIEKIVTKSKWLNAVSVLATLNQLNQLISYPFIKKIDLVKKFKRHQPDNPAIQNLNTIEKSMSSHDYGNSYTQNAQINVPAVHDLGINGAGVLICMLDNNYNLLEHEAFSSMNIVATWDFINNDSTVNDFGEGTHGTLTLSTVGGFSPGSLIGPAFGADYILGKTEVYGSETPIEEDYWVAGAEWADSLGADILSSSLGYIDWYTWQDMDGNTAVTTIAADIAVSKGIVVVNSAGNEGVSTHNTLIAPADGDSVIAVAAVNAYGNRSGFSSVGPTADGRIKPDVAAMGSSVHVASPYNPNSYILSSGTSFSCPLTSGVAALVLSKNPTLTPMQVRDALRETASQSAAPDNYLGWGILDAYQAVFYFAPKITHIPLSDTTDLYGPYEIVAEIESLLPLDSSQIKIVYGNDTHFGNEKIMNPTGSLNEFYAQIQGTGAVTEYFYYIEATNDQQISSTLPFEAPQAYFRFYAGPDTVNTSIVENESLPVKFSVLQNYPNPFNPYTIIKYALPKEGNVELLVYNLNGQQVYSRNISNQKSGWHTINFNPSKISSGVYFYQVRFKDIEGKSMVQNRKMVYIQ